MSIFTEIAKATRPQAKAIMEGEIHRFLFGGGDPPTVAELAEPPEPEPVRDPPAIAMIENGTIKLQQLSVEQLEEILTGEQARGLRRQIVNFWQSGKRFVPVQTKKTPAQIAAAIVAEYTAWSAPQMILPPQSQQAILVTEEVKHNYLRLMARQFGISHPNCHAILTGIDEPGPRELIDPGDPLWIGFRDLLAEICNDHHVAGANAQAKPLALVADQWDLAVAFHCEGELPTFHCQISMRLWLRSTVDERSDMLAGVLREVRAHVHAHCQAAEHLRQRPAEWEERALDMATTVIGYRAFRIEDVGTPAQPCMFELRSTGAGRATAWHTGQDMTARCLRYRHPAPAPDCHCGFNCYHALQPLLDRWNDTNNIGYPDVVGLVQAWGAIEVHHDGFRAEHVRPIALLDVESHSSCETLGAAAAASGLPVWQVPDHQALLAEFGEPVPELLRPPEPRRRRLRPGAYVGAATAPGGLNLTAPPTFAYPAGTVLTECPVCSMQWPMPVEVPALVHCRCQRTIRLEAGQRV